MYKRMLHYLCTKSTFYTRISYVLNKKRCYLTNITLFSKHSYILSLKKKVLSVKWYLLSSKTVLLLSFWVKQKVVFVM